MPQPKQAVLEPAATKLAEETGHPPFLFQFPPDERRKALEDLQAGGALKPPAEVSDIVIDGALSGTKAAAAAIAEAVRVIAAALAAGDQEPS